MRVYALVGPSGTGKSHNAMLVAHQHQIDLVIDDGLLIAGGKIVGGSSAKREQTRLGAIRRAIFSDPDHAATARRLLAEQQPESILVLGTSDDMIGRIRENLGLPALTQTIRIEQVSSPLEIRKALRTRRERGRHVIPAPTLEVRKTFSGYLIDPLKLFVRGRGDEQLYYEKSVVRPTFSSLGKFTIADVVIIAIAARAARDVEGVRRPGRVTMENTSAGVALTIDVVVRYGHNVPQVLTNVQTAVRDMMERMTALNVISVDVIARKMSYE